MSEHTKTYFSTRFSSLIGDGGGHSCKSALLEALDNSKDAFKKTNVANPVIMIVMSSQRNIFAIFDNATGTEDIRAVWGSGEISKKTADCIGKKMTGCLAADLYFVPETTMYYSFNHAFNIPLQYSKWDVKGMCGILTEEPNMRLADDKIKDFIEMQRNKKLKDLHPTLLAELKETVGNHPAICSLIDSKLPMFGKIIIGGEGNPKFELLKNDFDKNINEILFFHYNQYIRQGLELRVINLDDGSTRVFNAETAQAYHILGNESIVDDHMQAIAVSVFESPDFGPIYLNRVHCLEVTKFDADNQLVVNYQNLNIKIKSGYPLTVLGELELVDYEAKKNDDQIQKTTCRAYVSCLSKSEREAQKGFIKEGAEELRKMQILINPGDGVRGLARIEYPEDWHVALRNYGYITVALCFETEGAFLNLSANKSNITRSNIDSNLLNVLKDSVLKVIKQYDYNNWKSDNCESRILASRGKFITALGLQNIAVQPLSNDNAVPLPIVVPIVVHVPRAPRVVSKTKQEVLQKLNAMTDQEVNIKYKDIDEIIKNNLGKITRGTSREILKLLLADIEDNPVISKGFTLFN